ncbi:flagellar basal body rod protein FlgB [Microbulbifer sp. TYP-18]|uniref:flagellar basal body rod protein FlgB n=1 Tax=Microbulbifer sp. TYP-18 TaxID=3230024 RepID=UPI0034C5E2CE
MIDILTSVTSEILGKALERTSLENRLIAGNVANIDTEGYRPRTTEFGIYYNELIDAAKENDIGRLQEIARNWSPKNEIDIHPTADKVYTDVEMVKLARNALHYQSILTAKSQLSSILKLAIKEGKE